MNMVFRRLVRILLVWGEGGGESRVHSFSVVIAFLQHTPKKSSASKMEGFPQNCRAIAQIIDRQNVGSLHVKTSDPEKDQNFTFP